MNPEVDGEGYRYLILKALRKGAEEGKHSGGTSRAMPTPPVSRGGCDAWIRQRGRSPK